MCVCFPAPIRAAEACRVPFLVCLESESEREVAQSCPTLCDPWTVGHHRVRAGEGPARNPQTQGVLKRKADRLKASHCGPGTLNRPELAEKPGG